MTAISRTDVDVSSTQTLTNKTLNTSRLNDTNGNVAVSLNPITSAVNYVKITNAAAGGAPQVSADGTSTDIYLSLKPKGAGGTTILSSNGANAAVFNSVASCVNYFILNPSATGNSPTFQAYGSDTDVSLNLTTKGAGVVQANGKPVVTAVSVPATAASTGTTGQIAYDASYVYICTATNTWKRAAIATW